MTPLRVDVFIRCIEPSLWFHPHHPRGVGGMQFTPEIIRFDTKVRNIYGNKNR
nr:MAG TPA: hypothetical protein [Caudoviricetes sp.]